MRKIRIGFFVVKTIVYGGSIRRQTMIVTAGQSMASVLRLVGRRNGIAATTDVTVVPGRMKIIPSSIDINVPSMSRSIVR